MQGYLKFKGFLVEKGILQEEIASLLGIPKASVNLILNGRGGRDFKGHQIKKICETYGISADAYFFTLKVSNVKPTEVRDEH